MPRIISALKGLWAGSYDSFMEHLEALDRMHQAPPEAEIQAQAYAQDNTQQDKYQGYDYMIDTFGSTAVVNISGRLTAKSSWLSHIFGMTGYDEISNAVTAAAIEPGIDNILLDIDSPGGAVHGLAEAAETIRAVDENVIPVSAFTSGSMHSAAYWLGSAAREIHATKMASIGSIGVIGVHFDESESLKQEGVKPTVFTAGKYKGVGNPYEPLSAEDKEYMQADIDEAYEFFVDAVSQNRGLPADYVRKNAADGQTFYGEKAKEVGLVDTISSFQGVVKLLDSSHNSPQPASQGGI